MVWGLRWCAQELGDMAFAQAVALVGQARAGRVSGECAGTLFIGQAPAARH